MDRLHRTHLLTVSSKHQGEDGNYKFQVAIDNFKAVRLREFLIFDKLPISKEDTPVVHPISIFVKIDGLTDSQHTGGNTSSENNSGFTFKATLSPITGNIQFLDNYVFPNRRYINTLAVKLKDVNGDELPFKDYELTLEFTM